MQTPWPGVILITGASGRVARRTAELLARDGHILRLMTRSPQRAPELPEAETAFNAALARNPSNAVAANELGIALRRQGKFPQAEAAYQRTITADPNYAPAYLNLGVLYDLYLGEPQKALDSFEHYIQLAGENKQVAGWVVELRKRVQATKKEPS